MNDLAIYGIRLAKRDRTLALEVDREPSPHPAAPFGWQYSSKQVLRSESSFAPLATPTARVHVSDLLP